MGATIFRRLAVTITRMIAIGKSADVARLMCHSQQTADKIYSAELYKKKVNQLYLVVRLNDWQLCMVLRMLYEYFTTGM